MKDFGKIETDYEFFMAHATEAEQDAALYARELSGFADSRNTIRLLDFGCGTGEFTRRLLMELNWPATQLELTLVEPVEQQRAAAAQKLMDFSARPILTAEAMPNENRPAFDLIVSNHVLYYVDDLAATLERLHGALAPGGQLALAIAGWDNHLMKLWQIGFAAIGRPVPYYAADDVEPILDSVGSPYRQARSDYELRFADTRENRLKILRFLFGDYLPEIGPERLAGEFDVYRVGDQIVVDTCSRHYVVSKA